MRKLIKYSNYIIESKCQWKTPNVNNGMDNLHEDGTLSYSVLHQSSQPRDLIDMAHDE